MSTVNQASASITERAYTLGFYVIIALYMLLIAVNTALGMVGSTWAAVNACAVIAISGSLWYIL